MAPKLSLPAGNGETGYADGQGAAARFQYPTGLALGKDGSILVADVGNNAVRRVTMEGKVSTVGGNGEAGCAEFRAAATSAVRAREAARCTH
jgi:hypothetical protein